MKGYSIQLDKMEDANDFAKARTEGVNISYRDLSQVCGRITKKPLKWVLFFLEKAALGELPVLFKRHNRHMGHRKELGGAKGRYPKKAALAVLKTVKSAAANALQKGLDEESISVLHAAANKKTFYPRMSSKGRIVRSNVTMSRIEVVLKGNPAPKPIFKKEGKKTDKQEKNENKEPKKEEPKKEKLKKEEPVESKSLETLEKKPEKKLQQEQDKKQV